MINLKNKKADVSVTLLVFMTLALCMFTLFYFYISEKNRETEIVTFGTLNDFYVQSDGMEYLIKNLAKEVIMGDPTMNSEIFLQKFKENFVLTYWNVKPGVVRDMRTGSYEVQIKNKVLYFTLKDFASGASYERKNGGICNVDYKRDLHFEIPFQQ